MDEPFHKRRKTTTHAVNLAQYARDAAAAAASAARQARDLATRAADAAADAAARAIEAADAATAAAAAADKGPQEQNLQGPFPVAPAQDPLVTFTAAPPAWFVYIPKTERRHMPPEQAPGRCAVPNAYGACHSCADADACVSGSARNKCGCYAEAKKGLAAMSRHGPGAVVVLVECGECKGCALPPPPTAGLPAGENPPRRACRPTQGGVAFKIEVRNTLTPKGLGVFALEDIPQGAFVLEYAGEALKKEEADEQLEAYDRARRRWIKRDERRTGERDKVKKEEDEEDDDDGGHGYDSDLDGSDEEEEDEPGGASGHALLSVRIRAARTLKGIVRADPPACIRVDVDATQRGNAARFINHRCADPSLGAVVVMPRGRTGGMGGSVPHAGVPLRVALFANRAIKTGEELTISYGEEDDEGRPPGSPMFPQWATRCCCRAAGCRGWLPGQE
jgi:hypothetical protein